MKYFYGLVFFLAAFQVTLGQSGVTFQSLPRDLQLFPRTAANQAIALVEGIVSDAAVTRVTLQLDREGTISETQQRVLSATNRAFRFEPLIRAELAEYSIRVYLHRLPGDSVLVAERNRILCGDLFLIYGQSNAFGLENLEKITVNDQFMRQCSYPFGSTDIPASMRWYPALQPYAAVGAFGLYMGEAIQKATQIPIGFINGAEGGAGIGQLTDRDAANPANLNTFYGRMLYRAQWAGVQSSFKAIIFKQGEAEAGSSPLNYPANFDRLYKLLRQDYGTSPKCYASQINVLTAGSPEAGALRDFQRRLPEIYPEIGNIATVGSLGYDGLHYDLPGSRQMGYEQARLLLRDVYGSKDTDQIDSPAIRKVIQRTKNDTITLVFDPEQQLRWPADSVLTRNGQTYTRRLLDIWLADGQPGRFPGGRAEGNRVYLALRQPAPLQTLSYFPPFYNEPPSGFYDGPTLTNRRGVRAFTFDRFPVARALVPVTNLAVTRTTQQQLTLSWTVSASGVTGISLERAGGGSTAFTQLASLPATATTYTDTPPGKATGTYVYRIRLISQQSESEPGNLAEGRLVPVPVCSLSVAIVGANSVDFGGSLSLSATVTGNRPNEPITYLWRGPGNAVFTTASVVQQGLTPNLSGPYGLTASQGGCTATTALSVTVLAPLATNPSAGPMRLWPNPAKADQSIHLYVPDALPGAVLPVLILDLQQRVMGQALARADTAGQLELTLPTLPVGLYVVVTGSSQQPTYRLLIN